MKKFLLIAMALIVSAVFGADIAALRKKAEAGDAEAQYNLGECFLNGDGVAKDMAEAVKWWRKAAEQGAVWAQYNLGVCFYEGNGVDKDHSEAVKWYRKAAEQGYAPARDALRRLEK